MFSLGGAHLLILLVTWGGAVVVIGGGVYLAVRLAVLHALKAHTRWIDAGKH